jgi:hypothetical protein
MSKRSPHAAFMATISLVVFSGWAPSASAQCPVTIEADLRGFAAIPPGGTWTLLSSGDFYCDGLALDGIAFTRNAEPDVDAIVRTYDVVIDLHSRPQNEDVLADLELVAIDGDRRLPLGKFTNIPLRAGEKASHAQTIALNAHDLESFFGGGRTPMLRITRETRAL